MAEQKLSRRNFLKLAGGTGAGILAGIPAGASLADSTAALQADELTLVLWVQGDTAWDFPFMNVQQTIIDHFRDSNPNINIERVGTTDVRLDERVLLTVRAGNPPDMTQFSSQFLESHVTANTLQPLDDYMAGADQAWVDDLLDIEVQNMTSRRTGSRYGVLNSIHSRALYYRTDLIPDAPSTWEELAQYALENTDADAGQWGYVFLGAAPWSVEVAFAPLIWSQGAALADENGQASWANEATEQVITWHRDAIYNQQFASIANVTGAYSDMFAMLRNGQVAMGIEGTAALGGVKNTDLWAEGNLWVAPIPAADADSPSRNFANGWSAGVPVGSAHPQESFDFIAFWGSKDMQVLHSPAEGGSPVVQSAWDELFTDDPVTNEVILPNLKENGRVMDPFVYYLEGITALARSIEEILTNPDAPIMEILESSQNEYNGRYFTEDGQLREIPGA